MNCWQNPHKPNFCVGQRISGDKLTGTFQRMLAAAGLSRDMSTGQQRTLYSLRHTYATMELMSGTDIHTLARQMGTSVTMLDRHYSKLTATMAAQQLA
jgi:integrase